MMMGSWSLLTFGGLPLIVGVAIQGSHFIACSSPVSQRLFSTRRFSARLRTSPFGVPIRCSSVLESRPNQIPSNQADSNLFRRAPGRRQATASPNNRIVLVYGTLLIFS